MSLSPKNDQQTTYGNYNVDGNDIGLEAAPVQKATPDPRPVVAQERRSETSDKTTERHKLQIELEQTLDLLDKHRTRRMIIMSLIHSVVSYVVLAFIRGSLPDELRIILVNALISLILGFISYIFHVSCFSAVTVSFTEIDYLENRAKILTDRIKTLK